MCFFFSSRRRHTRCALVTGVQTCALPIYRYPSEKTFLIGGIVWLQSYQFHLRQHKADNIVLRPVLLVDLGSLRLFRRKKGPVFFVLSALLAPFLDQTDQIGRAHV